MQRPNRSFTLADVSRRLGVPQHRLIYLCEKEVVVPDVQNAMGRGSSRVFSERNLVELAIALGLHATGLPMSVARAIIHVLRAIEERIRDDLPDFSLTDSLRGDHAPDLRAIISDGARLYFALGQPGKPPRIFGGVALDDASHTPIDAVGAQSSPEGFGGPEGSRFVRTELSLTAVAQSIPPD